MVNLSKFSLSSPMKLKIMASLILAALFLPVRHVFLTSQAYLTGQYSDFTSFSLYLSDIFIFTTWFLILLPRGRAIYHVVEPLKWLMVALLLGFIVNFGLYKAVNLYFLAKWLEIIVAYGTLAEVFRQFNVKTLILKLFMGFGTFESLLALVQFWKQSSVGLYRLGEQNLSPSILGVAKIVSSGTTFIRGYGTFSHPNPLSAFLVAAVFMVLYFFISSKTKKEQVLYGFLLFLNILGLTVTFSRGAYLALGAGMMIFFGFILFKLNIQIKNKVGASIVLIVVCILLSFFIFRPFLVTRATFSDQSTIYRKFYDVIGLKMAGNNPIFGVGLGESVLHMEQYSQKVLAPWDKQPPHNYFIIAAAEIGIPAALFLLWFFLYNLWCLIRKIIFENAMGDVYYAVLLTTILCTFLILMQFDHYFYTLEQTRLLLWLILALIAGQIKNPSPS